MAKKKTNCTCKLLTTNLFFIRLLGLCPVKSDHSKQKCVYKLSYFWFVYSIVLLASLSTYVFYKLRSENFAKNKFFFYIIDDIANIMRFALTALLMLLSNTIQLPKILKTLNLLLEVAEEVKICNSAIKVANFLQSCQILTASIFVATQLSAVAYLKFSEGNYGVTYFNFLDNFIYDYVIFYVLFLSTVFNAVISIMACHEKLSLKCIDYTPIHPLKGIHERNNKNYFFGIFTYEMCKQEHFPCGWLAGKIKTVQVENLRRIHENICNVICRFNDGVAMQLLVFVVISLCVLILQLYCVIIYLAYEFRSFEIRAIFIQQSFSVAMQCAGVFFLFRSVQSYYNQIKGFGNVLIEYSTRISSEEDHQQVRLFIEKLKTHRPFTIYGIFTPDLELCGPICANILTYVLVALQFEIPEVL